MPIEIFLHQRVEAIKLAQADPDKSVEAFLAEWGGAGAGLWLEDSDEALSAHLTLAAAGVIATCHVHVSSCAAIALKVRFNGRNVEGKFSPASTVGTVLKWAGGPEGFKLTDSQIAKHVLVVQGTDTELQQADHIGSWADENCSVSLDLVPAERFQG